MNSNDKVPNPNVTVFEWLNHKAAYRGRVAAVGAWDAFPAIFNAERAGLPVMAGYDPLTTMPSNLRVDLINHLKAETLRYWEDEPFDSFTFYTALEYLKERKPRVFFISLGETDEWAHDQNYAPTISTRPIAWITTCVSSGTRCNPCPSTATRRLLIFSPDHGRGNGPKWTDHGSGEPSSKYIWMAFLGPDTKALGERSGPPPATQNQIAATLAAFLGEDYNAEVPKSGKPIAEVLP